MATIFKNVSDDFIKAKLFENFSFLTGESRPEQKGKTKNGEEITPEMWFHEMSWVHCFIFCQAFHEATDRGILNAVEQRMAQECFDIIEEMTSAW